MCKKKLKNGLKPCFLPLSPLQTYTYHLAPMRESGLSHTTHTSESGGDSRSREEEPLGGAQRAAASAFEVRNANGRQSAASVGRAMEGRNDCLPAPATPASPQTVHCLLVCLSLAHSCTPSVPPSPQVQLVLEFCDRGDLRDALEAGAFRLHSRSPPDPAVLVAAIPVAASATAASGPNPLPASVTAAAEPIDYLSVLETAADIARGMAHLHACNIMHLDLKVG